MSTEKSLNVISIPLTDDEIATDAITAAKKAKNQAKNDEKRQAKLKRLAAKQVKLVAEMNKSISNKNKHAAEHSTTAFKNKTPKGEKKDLTVPMATSYDPRAVESAWYDWWVKEGFFEPALTQDGSIKSNGLFVVPAPPPNITGSLHIGHALTVALQDTLVRWQRMLGKTVLFSPGTDHAGISCQSVVERKLWFESRTTRHDLGREAFVDKVWEWKAKYGDRIHEQFHRLGASYDWDRVAFTMDAKLSKAVRETFVRLHREGTIYRANRLINWCVRLNTALSNLEVENMEISERTLMHVPGYNDDETFEFGVLNEFAYQVDGGDGDERIVVATTRIETILGDTAIAVHPDDKRYAHLHGKSVIHPFLDRKIPIITDAMAVDMAFGTGAVKITPAHDFNDYDVGKRHNLEFINIMNDDGTMNDNAGGYAGMKRFHVRTKVIQDLKARGLFVGAKSNPMTVPICRKSGDVIEPLMKPQWWVNCKPMAEAACQAVRDGQLKITPKVSEGDWFRWLENIQDWCISRQLWWGHRVPAYHVVLEDSTPDYADGTYWVSGHDEADARNEAEKRFPGKTFTLEQDHDVLDTWFSAGLWPFSIMGWPDKTDDMMKFYPASLLETGWDILFFWVARMVMFGIKLTGQVPFSEVFCHAMIRDAHGRKMSKSLGNVIDPVDIMEGITLNDLHSRLLEGNLDPKEIAKAKIGQKTDFPKGIPECGTDALRFALCSYTTGGRDINLDILRVEGYRKFCNKIWNATRFAMMKLGSDFKPVVSAKMSCKWKGWWASGEESLADKWILDKLNKAAVETNKALTERNFKAATQAVYQFWLYDLCDVYIEVIKPICDDINNPRRSIAQNTLYTCIDAGLKILHPFCPFVTEELYQRLQRRPSDTTPSIVMTSYPVNEPSYINNNAKTANGFDIVIDICKCIRSLAVQLNKKIVGAVHVQTETKGVYDLLMAESSSIMALARGTKDLTISSEAPCLVNATQAAQVNVDITVYLEK